MTWAWRQLTQSGGAVRVEALSRELGCSRRHLSRRFREEIGLAPKAYARVLRFNRAARLLTGPGADLAGTALTCGYADQSHFNRDFRAMSGTTPTEYLAARMGVGGVQAPADAPDAA